MIYKQELEGTEYTFVMFGGGTVLVQTVEPINGYGYKGIKSDMMVSEVEEPHEIGLVQSEDEKAEKSSELKNPIMFRFSKSKSVDVVIHILQKIKTNLMSVEGADNAR